MLFSTTETTWVKSDRTKWDFVCVVNGEDSEENCYDLLEVGRAVAQAVSSRVPTATVRVRVQVRSYKIYGG
jgi:hypothetical protein